MKKAQIEIIGLVFIVLIITVGFLFYISYSLDDNLNPKNTYYQDYKNVATANNFINTLMIININSYTFRDLVKDCATSKKFNFATGDSCDTINYTITNITTQTLDKWGMQYGILIQYNKNSNLTIQSPDKQCQPRLFNPNVSTSAPGYFPISLYPFSSEPAFIELVFCS